MQAMMTLVMVFSCVVLGLHMYITQRFPAIPAAPLPEEGLTRAEALNEDEPSPGEVGLALLALLQWLHRCHGFLLWLPKKRESTLRTLF